MKKAVVIVLIVVTVFAMTAFLYGVFAAKEKNSASTVTPVTTPVATIPVAPQPTIAPTPNAPIPPAMTAEGFFQGLHEKRISGVRGTEITFTGVIASKNDKSIYFNIEWNHPIRGELTFIIAVRLANGRDLSTVTVGETVTVRGEMDYMTYYQSAALDKGRIIKN